MGRKNLIYVQVSLPVPLMRDFSYSHAEHLKKGIRVRVPFGRRKLVGVVLGSSEGRPSHLKLIKSIDTVLDLEPVLSKHLLEMADFMSTYYMHPLGEVLKTMVPSGTKKLKKDTAVVESGVELPPEVARCFNGRSKLAWVTFKKKCENYQTYVSSGHVKRLREESISVRTASKKKKEVGPTLDVGAPQELTGPQREVYNDVISASGGFAVHLLYGLTGSGKTEVYLQLIDYFLSLRGHNAQVLVLVPEISLTPQMTKIFDRRFPGSVAIVHSALTQSQRWKVLDGVREGVHRILIGPRSAIFAPFSNLSFIVCDEEHDASYKQTTGLTYSGRDMAVLRSKIEGVPILLGSATPSAESYNNAKSGKYHLHRMLSRVNGRPLPSIEILEHMQAASGQKLGRSSKSNTTGLFHPLVIGALKEKLECGEQAIVIVNRRGFSHFLFNLRERKAVPCPRCSISLTSHNNNSILRCHYCDYKKNIEQVYIDYGHRDFVAVGCGSQQAEQLLAEALPTANIKRLDADVAASVGRLEECLAAFGAGDIDILLGTQMLAKGHDYPKVTLTVILEIDQLLSFPDFRAAERAYQLVVQAAGRAGRAHCSLL